MCGRLRSDYEAEMNNLKQAIRQQNEHIRMLEAKGLEDAGQEVMKKMKIEHQQKVCVNALVRSKDF